VSGHLWEWARAERDRITGWAFVTVGAVVLLVGMWRVRDSAFVADQLTLLMSGGIGGLFCLGLGATMLLSADVRDDWRRLDILSRSLQELRAMAECDLTGPPPPERPQSANSRTTNRPAAAGRGERP
jgi:hypothetical protein